jgi:hypothetical protein
MENKREEMQIENSESKTTDIEKKESENWFNKLIVQNYEVLRVYIRGRYRCCRGILVLIFDNSIYLFIPSKCNATSYS